MAGPSTFPTSKKPRGLQWQDRLRGVCRNSSLPSPAFQIYSDRRGGRTAWSSSVFVCGMVFSARYWYDGKNINNAREDAAEVAFKYCHALLKSY